jgi:hypothetical protein
VLEGRARRAVLAFGHAGVAGKAEEACNEMLGSCWRNRRWVVHKGRHVRPGPLTPLITSPSLSSNVDSFHHHPSTSIAANTAYSVLQPSTMTSVKTPTVLWAQRSSATNEQKVRSLGILASGIMPDSRECRLRTSST